MKKSRLVIGDIHEPYAKRGYLEFCLDVQRKFGCDPEPVFIGDIIDAHALSAHDHDPDLPSPGNELDGAVERLHRWYEAFPDALVCYGNHDARWMRQALKAGLPERVVKGYKEVLEAPKGWKFERRWFLDEVLYTHGSSTGRLAAVNLAIKHGMSAVMGHTHSCGGVIYQQTYKRGPIFGLNVGCGIDYTKRAFRYAADTPELPTIGCGVVVNKHCAFFVPMV